MSSGKENDNDYNFGKLGYHVDHARLTNLLPSSQLLQWLHGKQTTQFKASLQHQVFPGSHHPRPNLELVKPLSGNQETFMMSWDLLLKFKMRDVFL